LVIFAFGSNGKTIAEDMIQVSFDQNWIRHEEENLLICRLILSPPYYAMPAMHRSTRVPRSPKPVGKTSGENVKGRSSTQTRQSD
jgi:hypothetical protein